LTVVKNGFFENQIKMGAFSRAAQMIILVCDASFEANHKTAKIRSKQIKGDSLIHGQHSMASFGEKR
jgi:hypothetical protein